MEGAEKERKEKDRIEISEIIFTSFKVECTTDGRMDLLILGY